MQGVLAAQAVEILKFSSIHRASGWDVWGLIRRRQNNLWPVLRRWCQAAGKVTYQPDKQLLLGR